jgi:hypothetical protein
VSEPLPPCEPGGPDPAAITASIEGWATSTAMVELVGHFTTEAEKILNGPIERVLEQLAEFSEVWNFRGGVKERFDTERIDFGPDVDPWVRERIRALGLGGRPHPRYDTYDHVVVLGGGIRVSLGRSDYTARLFAGGLSARTLAGLGSLRRRDDREHREGVRLGLGPIETEADMMAESLGRFFGLAEPATVRRGEDWWHRSWAGPGAAVAHVLAAASTRPPLRANTADTLIGWAEHVGAPAPTDRVLLVTNDPYVRHQHCDAIRLLGDRYGCGIETVGFDELAMQTWGRPLSTTELLQEVRSSLLSMRNLHEHFNASRCG